MGKAALKGSGSIFLTCTVCGEDYLATPSRVANGAKYCSVPCMSKALSSVPNLTCSVCGKEFYRKPSSIAKTRNNACSYACSAVMKSQITLGVGNHQYGLRGEENASYSSDIRVSRYGYVFIRDVNHPFRTGGSFVSLHRLVMEEHLRASEPDSPYLVTVEGCLLNYLDPHVVIHHKNKKRTDNRISNLEIMDRDDHTALHQAEPLNGWVPDENGDYVKLSGRLVNSSANLRALLKKHEKDAGLDVTSAVETIVPARGRKVVSTQLQVKVPDGFVGLLWSRSGLSVTHGIQVGAGCIDSTYTGELKVVLYNFSDCDYTIQKGDRVAQLLTIPVNLYDYVSVKSLAPTERGESGFGSTGRGTDEKN